MKLNRIIVGVSLIDAQIKQQEEEKKRRLERTMLGRVAALSPDSGSFPRNMQTINQQTRSDIVFMSGWSYNLLRF